MGRNKKGILALAAVLLCVLAAVAFLASNEKSSPVEKLEESIACSDGTLSFTIPEAYDSSWYLQISGRLERRYECALSGGTKPGGQLGEKCDLFVSNGRGKLQ